MEGGISSGPTATIQAVKEDSGLSSRQTTFSEGGGRAGLTCPLHDAQSHQGGVSGTVSGGAYELHLKAMSGGKEDPAFDLKPLPDDLKYVYIDDKKIYPVIISSKLSGEEETKLLANRPFLGLSFHFARQPLLSKCLWVGTYPTIASSSTSYPSI